MKLYIAGPMTGLPDYNYPCFNAAADKLRAEEFEVVSPAENDLPPGQSWQAYMRHAIPRMLECDGVATLNAWERSKGAKLEVHIALTLGMPVRSVAEWLQ